MIYVWAAPRAAASDSLAQELRCSPIMIYMHASPLPQRFLPPSQAPPWGPICRVAAALPLACLAAAGCCRRKSKREAAAGPRLTVPLLQKDRTPPRHCPSTPPTPRPRSSRPQALVTICLALAPDEHKAGSIFSFVQKVPIHLGAPALSRLPGAGRVVRERLQERARASLRVQRRLPERGK